jgi:hypothetical protein
VPNMRSKLVTAAAIGAAAVGGGAIANAATSTTSSTSSTPTTSSAATTPSAATSASAMPAHGTAAHEDAEKTITGTDAAKAQAAAVKSVGSGTAGPVTTDFTGDGYEVTVTKADGSTVDVHLDSSFAVSGGPGGHGDHAADVASGAPAGPGA